MKAILVMEMPESCNECPLEMDVEDTTGKQWKGNICRGCGSRNEDRDERPDWCPLVPMPGRRKERSFKETKKHPYTGGFFDGWNACLNVIEGKMK